MVEGDVALHELGGLHALLQGLRVFHYMHFKSPTYLIRRDGGAILLRLASCFGPAESSS